MPRYHVPITMTAHVYVDMPNAVAAQNKVREALMTARYQDALSPALHEIPGAQAFISFGPCPAVNEVNVLNPDTTPDPRERLAAIWKNSFLHAGPHVKWTPELLATAQAVFKEIDNDEARLEAHAMFQRHGVDLGPIFTGEWFGYECTGGEHYDLGLRGYDNGIRWNGWAVPLLTLEGIRGIVAWQATLTTEDLEATDTLEVIDAVSGGANVYFVSSAQTRADNPDDEPRTLILPRTVVTQDGFREVYEVPGDWCWSVYREGTPETPAFKKLVG